MTEPTAAPAPAPASPSAAAPAAGTPPLVDEGRYAPRPSKGTLRMRSFLPIQIWRFLAINLRMSRIIFKSHD